MSMGATTSGNPHGRPTTPTKKKMNPVTQRPSKSKYVSPQAIVKRDLRKP